MGQLGHRTHERVPVGGKDSSGGAGAWGHPTAHLPMEGPGGSWAGATCQVCSSGRWGPLWVSGVWG